jgi:hypothetical protein
VIAGERDLITPPLNQRLFAKLIPGAEYHEIEEGSHCSQMEKPGLVNGLLRDFFARVESAKPRPKKKTAPKPRARIPSRSNKPGRAD